METFALPLVRESQRAARKRWQLQVLTEQGGGAFLHHHHLQEEEEEEDVIGQKKHVCFNLSHLHAETYM